MKIKDIFILKSLNPIEIEKNPSDASYEFLHKLISDKKFTHEIIKRRLELGIPENGLDIKKEFGKNFYSINDRVLDALKLIGQQFSIDTGDNEEYLLQIILIFFYNSILEVTKMKPDKTYPIEFVFGNQRIFNRAYSYKRQVGAIFIPFNISKTRLKKWLDSNWNKMTDDMANNAFTNVYTDRIHKNIIKEEEIREFKEQGKSVYQIAKIFKVKYPDERWYPSKITKIYLDEKQRLELQKLLYNHK